MMAGQSEESAAMTPGTTQAPKAGSDVRAAGTVALKVVLAYAVFAGLWILLSDKALGWLFKVIGMFGISRDITECQQAETALRRNIGELERFNGVAVGRELEMIGLKRQVNALSRQLGLVTPFAPDFADSPAADTRG